MRISDWSSDVCSSDLLGAEGVVGPDPYAERVKHRVTLAIAVRGDDGLHAHQRVILERHGSDRIQGKDRGGGFERMKAVPKGRQHGACDGFGRPDRKSVVSGKRVSVRGVLGGGRGCKKKKKA